MDKFEQAVSAALSYEGDRFEPVAGSHSQTYRNEFGEEKQVIAPADFPDWVREQFAAHGNGVPTEDDLNRAQEDTRQILIDYDLDEHGNRYSQFFFVIDL
jgi:hypothetical protein